jgi:hypothetical protein
MKYVVASGHSFTSKGKIYSPGDEVSISAFSREENFRRFLEKGQIIEVNESNTGKTVADASRRKKAAEDIVKIATETVITTENDFKKAEIAYNVAKESYGKAAGDYGKATEKNADILAANKALIVAAEETEKAKKSEAKASAQLKYTELQTKILAIQDADVDIKAARHTLDAAEKSLDVAGDAKAKLKQRLHGRKKSSTWLNRNWQKRKLNLPLDK